MLSAIKANNPSSEEQYTEMLSRWIDAGTATVKRLINALEANTVRMNGIAERLKEKYAEGATPQEGRPMTKGVGKGGGQGGFSPPQFFHYSVVLIIAHN